MFPQNNFPPFLFNDLLETIYLYYFREAIDEAVKYKDNPTDIDDQILEELDNFHFEGKKADEDEKED